MKQFLSLIKVQFKGLLSSTVTSSKRKARSLWAMLLFVVALMLYVSLTFTLTMADALQKAGMIDLLLVLMGIMTLFIPVLMSSYSVSGFLYKAKDLDMLFSMPISAIKIVLSKLVAVYLENLVFVFFLFVPALGTFAYLADEPWTFYPYSVVVILLFPLLVTVIGLLVGYLLSLLQSRLKHQALITNILYLAFFGLVMYGNFKLNSFIGSFTMMTGDIRGAFQRYARPIYWIRDALVDGNLVSLLLFALACIIPFILVALWFSGSYRHINSDLQISRFKTVYTFKKMDTQSPFMALFKKEIRRYFGSSIYFMNTFVGVLMPLAALIYLMVSKSSRMLVNELLGVMSLPVWAVLTVILMVSLGMTNTTAPSISLETNKLWILKEAPLKVTEVFGAKIALNLLICVPSILIATILSSVMFKLILWQTLFLFVLPTLQCLLNAMMGLYANLLFPKLDAPSDTVIVKQSASTIISMVMGMLSAVILGIVGYQLSKMMDGPLVALLVMVVLLLMILLMYKLLTTKGRKLYNGLSA